MDYEKKLPLVKQVFYHASCPDGTVSAMLTAMAFRRRLIDIKEIEFISVQYGTPEYESMEAKGGQMFVDICPPKARWKEWLDFHPIVFDHHVTSKEVVEGLSGVYKTNEEHCGAKIVFDELLTDFIMEGIDRFAHLSMIRDTWKKDHEDWEEACYLAQASRLFKPKDLISQAYIEGVNSLERLMPIGKALHERAMRKSKLVARTSPVFIKEINGKDIRISIFNCTDDLTSDISHFILESREADVAVAYSFLGKNREGDLITRVSLRTNGDFISARKICEKYGGGGHDGAAGFSVSNDDGFNLVFLRNMIFEALKEQIVT